VNLRFDKDVVTPKYYAWLNFSSTGANLWLNQYDSSNFSMFLKISQTRMF